MKLSKLKRFDDFEVGDLAFFSKSFESPSFKSFEELSGDKNPLHCDTAYAADSEFGATVVPVHMVIAPLSRVAGMIFPGKPSLYLSQDVEALKPVFFGEELIYSAKIVAINSFLRTLSIKVLVIRGSEVVVDAYIVVKSLHDKWEQDYADDHSTIANKRCLITGATGEIGSALAVKMAEKGVDLILQSRGDAKKREALENRLSKVTSKDQKVIFTTADLLVLEEVGGLCDTLIDNGGVDYVVHLASSPLRSKIEELVKVNFSALELITNAVIPGMLVRQKGIIVSVGSIATERYIPGWQNYSAVKAMTTQYISSIDRQYSEFGVRGLGILMGLVATKFSSDEGFSSSGMLPEEAAEGMLDAIIEQNIGQSLILDIDTINYGKYGFYENSIASGFSAVKSAGPDVNPGDSFSLSVVSNDADLESNISLEVEKIIASSLNLADVDLSNGGLGITPGWDSLRHIEIILDLENQFNCKFSSQDIDKFTTVRQIVQTISNFSLRTTNNGKQSR